MDIPIQHTKIIKKSDVPHFYQKMLLTFTFKENLSSLLVLSRPLVRDMELRGLMLICFGLGLVWINESRIQVCVSRKMKPVSEGRQ